MNINYWKKKIFDLSVRLSCPSNGYFMHIRFLSIYSEFIDPWAFSRGINPDSDDQRDQSNYIPISDDEMIQFRNSFVSLLSLSLEFEKNFS